MVTLRLARAGSNKRPVYHVVATDHRFKRDGRHLERLGFFFPIKDQIVLKHDRVDYWLSVGAKPSPTVKTLIKKSKKAVTPSA